MQHLRLAFAALVAALALLLALSSETRVAAQEFLPSIQGDLQTSRINLFHFSPGATLTVSVGVPGEQPVTVTTPVGDDGGAVVTGEDHGRTLVPGTSVDVSDSAGEIADYVLEPLTIDSPVLSSGSVSGTAPPGRVVHVLFLVPPGSPSGGAEPLVATANDQGNWVLSFDPAGVEDAVSVSASIVSGAHSTLTRALIPSITGSLTHDFVGVSGAAPNTTLLVLIELPGGSGSASQPTTTDGNGRAFLPREAHDLDLVVGTTITVAQDDTPVATFTLEALTIDPALDLASGSIGGTAPPGRSLTVFFFPTEPPLSFPATADQVGQWSVEFAPPDLSGVVGASANLRAGRHSTHAQTIPPPPPPPPAPQPSITGHLTGNFVVLVNFEAGDFEAGTTLTVDVATPGQPVVTVSTTVEPAAPFVVIAGGAHGFTLAPGTAITVREDSQQIASHTLEPITIDPVLNVSSGSIGGTTLSHRSVQVLFLGPPSSPPVGSVETSSDGAGDWTVTFAPEALEGATGAVASVMQGPHSTTVQTMPPPFPRITVNVYFDRIEAHGFAASATLGVHVHDAPGGTLLWSATREADEQGAAAWTRGDHRLSLLPGMQVTVTDGTTTKSHVLVAQHLGVWPGGSVAELVQLAIEAGAGSLQAAANGMPVTYIIGAPLLVNETFVDAFEAGVPEGTEIFASRFDGEGDSSVFHLYSADSDGDGIDDVLDGHLADGAFVDESAVYSDRFTDATLGGTTSGTIVDRGAVTIRVRPVTEPGVFIEAIGLEGAGTVSLCSLTLGVSAGSSFRAVCGSLSVQVLTGEITIHVGDATVTVPAGATATVSESATGEILVVSEPSSTAAVIIRSGDVETTVGPGASFHQVRVTIGHAAAQPHPVNPRSNAAVAVVLHGSATFDISEVDPGSVRLGDAGVTRLVSMTDRDGDGFDDLVLEFRARDIGLGETTGSGIIRLALSGETNGGSFAGWAGVRVLGR